MFLLINETWNKRMQDLSTIFSALGDPTRFSIVERLLKEGEQSVGDLLDAGPVSAPAISRHLKVLRQAGIVEQRVDRQRRIYSVRPEAVQSIGAWSMSHRDFWQGSLDRLELALQQESQRK
jgi:DNA-binding transcriptional ArsR family regulator